MGERTRLTEPTQKASTAERVHTVREMVFEAPAFWFSRSLDELDSIEADLRAQEKALQEAAELLKDAIENIEGLESFRPSLEKALHPESRARYDVGKALALLAPATPKAQEGETK